MIFGPTTLLVALAVFAIAAALFIAYRTASRLDRLHIRTDLARQSLGGILARRHLFARTVAILLEQPQHPAQQPRPTSGELLDAAEDATRASMDGLVLHEGEAAENTLTTMLDEIASELPAPLLSELVDLSDRLVMARRFHNDSVRDTRNLRARRVVAGLRLAGRAPLPAYVELTDPCVLREPAE